MHWTRRNTAKLLDGDIVKNKCTRGIVKTITNKYQQVQVDLYEQVSTSTSDFHINLIGMVSIQIYQTVKTYDTENIRSNQ